MGCTACSQFLYPVVEQPLKMSVAPEIAVTTDPVVIEQEPSCETRHRLRERKTGPDGSDTKDAEVEAALDDPACIRPWLPCRDIRGLWMMTLNSGHDVSE